MKCDWMASLVAAVAALHVALLSLFFGLRHQSYMLTATFSATLIWGGVFYLSERRRGPGILVGVVLGAVVQQVAYEVWRAQLPGFWWPAAQFAALQVLIAFGISRTVV